MNSLQTKATVQRVLDILQAAQSPVDLRLKANGGTIAQYIYGKPTKGALSNDYPAIWVASGSLGSTFYEDYGIGNTSQKGNLLSITIGIIVKDENAEKAAQALEDLHDAIRFVMRQNPELRNPASNDDSKVESTPLAWVSMKESAEVDNDYIEEAVIILRYEVFEDTS